MKRKLIDEKGRLNLSRKDALAKPEENTAE